MPPKWFQLLQAHQDHAAFGQIGTALTIPFLIGALRGPRDTSPMSPATAKERISTLLDSFMNETPKQNFISIYKCSDDKAVQYTVVRYEPISYSPHHAFLDPTGAGRKTLAPSSQDYGSTGSLSIDQFIDQLDQEFGSALSAAEFSYDRRTSKYRPFSDEESAAIEAVIGA